MEGIGASCRLYIEGHFPAMEISRQTNIRIRDLIGPKIIADIPKAYGPVWCQFHAAYHIDAVRGDDCSISSRHAKSHDAQFVVYGKIADQIQEFIF